MEPNDFEQIVSGHYESLYRFAFSLTRVEADAQELTQEAFYVLAAKGHQLRDRSKVKNWLFTILHRAFLEIRRQQRRFPHYGLGEVPVEELPMLAVACVETADHVHVLRALAQVDEVFQSAVALFYLKGCSHREIAEALRVPTGTVKSRIARGLTQIRQILSDTQLNFREAADGPAL
jgi:RNA polymerase sigma-70 factor (ECF subfamily)